jgi:serine/threonine protein kinase/tetratricopeptide (TPR) repeat protein
MMSDLGDKAKNIFLGALEQSGDLEAFLAEACGDDAELRGRVQALLDAHHEAGEFLAPSRIDETIDSGNPSPVEMTQSSSATEARPSSRIGPYKLLEQIGEGGMGSVWVASQSKPIKRKVAIKLVKAGMDSKQVLARFEAERQALAMMDHPNIARVLDGGMTEQGRPYFAMEYVRGVPLTKYCDDAMLSLKERLELFVPICHAVQHAHQKGIIHRDLKPSNILVCLYDGKPVPKVIDFGLAKAMHHSLTEQSLYTAHGMMVGTPLYMSPEQAELNNLDIDTRTDVYALGVILYELLTGTTPLEKGQMKRAAYNEVLRLIKEVEPLKPSTRLSGSDALPSIAAQRGIEPAKLTRSITGDLDWVVMKALEKERSRRYETANGLAEDICRHLADEPVSASPPSTRYRMRKFVRRNRAGVIAASAIAIALLLGVAGTTGGMFWALAERKDAVAAREAESVAKEEAIANAKLAEENAKLSHDTTRLVLYDTKSFFEANPDLQPLRESLMTQLVERLEQHYAQHAQDNPSAVFSASADRQLGEIYLTIGNFRKAVEKLEESQRQLRTLAAAGQVAGAASSQMHITLGLADAHYGLGDIKKAKNYYLDLEKQCLAIKPGDEPFNMIPLPTVYMRLGKAYRNLGNPELSRQYLVKTERLRREVYEKNPKSIAAIEDLSEAVGELGQMYARAGDTKRMLESTNEAIRLKMELPATNLNKARQHNLARDQKNLAQQYLLVNQELKSKELLEKAADTLDDLLRNNDDARIQSLARNTYYLQGIVLDRLGEDATKSFERAERVQRRLLEKSDNRIARGELMKIFARAGRVDEAMELADQLAGESNESVWNCGYAACGYALIAEQLPEDDPQRAALIGNSIELTRRLIRKHQYRDFESLRSTDIDFEPLQQDANYLKMLEEEQKRVEEVKSQDA